MKTVPAGSSPRARRMAHYCVRWIVLREGVWTHSSGIYCKSSGGALISYEDSPYSSSITSGLEPTAKTGNPPFVDHSVSSFTLQKTNPAVDTGENVGLTADALG